MSRPLYPVGHEVRLRDGGPWMRVVVHDRSAHEHGGWACVCALPDGTYDVFDESLLEERRKTLIFWALPARGHPSRADEIAAMRAYVAVHGDDYAVVPAWDDDVAALDLFFLVDE